jgi:hypothetical protein
LYVPLLVDFVGPQALLWGWAIALFALGFAVVFLYWARALLVGRPASRAARLARSGFALYAASMVIFAVMFASAGRYMDIPLPHAILPLGAVATLLCIARLQPGATARDCALSPPGNRCGRYAVWLLPLAALVCLWGEVAAMRGGEDFIALHPTVREQIPLIAGSIASNGELLSWCAANLLLGLAFWLSLRLARRVPAVAD